MKTALLFVIIPALGWSQSPGEKVFAQSCATGYCHGAKGAPAGARGGAGASVLVHGPERDDTAHSHAREPVGPRRRRGDPVGWADDGDRVRWVAVHAGLVRDRSIYDVMMHGRRTPGPAPSSSVAKRSTDRDARRRGGGRGP